MNSGEPVPLKLLIRGFRVRVPWRRPLPCAFVALLEGLSYQGVRQWVDDLWSGGDVARAGVGEECTAQREQGQRPVPRLDGIGQGEDKRRGGYPQVQVSPSAALLARPPNSTTVPVAASYADPASNRAAGWDAGAC